jgi:hypothetical protein
VKTTRYFDEQVVRKQPYIRCLWFTAILAASLRRYVQPDEYNGGEASSTLATANSVSFVSRHWKTVSDPQRVLRPRLPGGSAMKLHYYPETDSLYIELKSQPGTEVRGD